MHAALESFYSRRDIFGNCYWAFRFTDANGKEVTGVISGGESNIAAVIRELGLKPEEVHYTVSELPIRQFNRLVKGWQYAGCPSADIARYIQTALAASEGSILDRMGIDRSGPRKDAEQALAKYGA